MALMSEWHEQLAEESQWDVADLKALFINCTLKRSPEILHMLGLATSPV